MLPICYIIIPWPILILRCRIVRCRILTIMVPILTWYGWTDIIVLIIYEAFSIPSLPPCIGISRLSFPDSIFRRSVRTNIKEPGLNVLIRSESSRRRYGCSSGLGLCFTWCSGSAEFLARQTCWMLCGLFNLTSIVGKVNWTKEIGSAGEYVLLARLVQGLDCRIGLDWSVFIFCCR